MHSIRDESPSDLSPQNAFSPPPHPILLLASKLFLAIREDGGLLHLLRRIDPDLLALQCGDFSTGPLWPDLGRKDDICHSVFHPASQHHTCRKRSSIPPPISMPPSPRLSIIESRRQKLCQESLRSAVKPEQSRGF